MTVTFPLAGEQENWADTLLRLPAQVRTAIQAGRAPEAVRLLIAGGKRDENWLTDVVFHVSHPRLRGRPIRPGEQVLAREWSSIRTGIVRPQLAAATAPVVIAAPPVAAVPPVRSVAQWRARALEAAGIDPAKWDPDAGFKVIKPIVEQVYAYYMKLFNRNENLLWAGMAKLAGGQVYRGLGVLQTTIDVAGMSGDTSPDVVIFYSNTVQVRLLFAQRAIFEDLAWQHQAFVEAGLPALVAAGSAARVDAWRDIASGDPARVRRGNKTLLRHEQEVVLAPTYTAIRDIRDFDMIPKQMSAEALSPVPGGKPFAEVVPGGDITVFADRWKWIETDMLPAYERLTPGRRRQLVNTPLADLADQRWPPG